MNRLSSDAPRRLWLLPGVAALLLAAGAGTPGCVAFRAEPPNIVLVVIDTLRPDALGSYGAAAPTPHLDAVAGEGLRFSRAVAQAPWTIPSLSSLLTSLYPSEHGQGTRKGPQKTSLTTLTQRLAARGYATAAFMELSAPLLRQGFQTFEVPTGDTDQRFTTVAQPVPSPTFARAVEWLRGSPQRPFFLMIHTYVVHDYFLGKPRQREYALARHPSYRGRFGRWRPRPAAQALGSDLIDELLEASDEDIAFVRSLYDGGVQLVDEDIGCLDAALGELGLKERTVLVVTADHGEGFAPRLHRVNHGGRLHDDLLHIPLVIRWPGHIRAGVEDGRVRSIDITPTLLRIAGRAQETGVEHGSEMRGTPLLTPERGIGSCVRGGRFGPVVSPGRTAFAEESAFLVLPSGRRIRSTVHQVALYEGRYQLIRGGGPAELFDVAEDPGEVQNLIEAQPQIAAAMGQRLGQIVRDLGTAEEGPDDELEESLRALGYIE